MSLSIKDAAYELVLTPGEVSAVNEAIAHARARSASLGEADDLGEAQPQHTISPFDSPWYAEDIESAASKITALWEYVQADRAAEAAQVAYRETLENVADAFKVEAF